MTRHIICPYCDTKIGVPTHIDFINTVRCRACHGLFDYDVNSDSTTARDIRDYYEILGVEPKISDGIIKRRFRELMMRFHPDHSPLQSEKTYALVKLVNEAYTALETPENRAVYDAKLAAEHPASLDSAASNPPDKLWTNSSISGSRSWGWLIVLLLLIILFFAHHGIPIGVHEFGTYYTDRITIYNAPVIFRHLYRSRMHPENRQ